MRKKVRGFFITGTGTDVGKTFAAGLLGRGISRVMPVSYMKPVQTGGARTDSGSYAAPDFEYVKKTGKLVLGPDALHVPYAFGPACSPHLAARLAGTRISLEKIEKCFNDITCLPGMQCGCILVEGAGGVLVPLGPTLSTVHLMIKLGLPVVLVSTAGLGTLNHTFLTLCALSAAGIPVAGLIVNNRHGCRKDFIYRDNIRVLRSHAKGGAFLELTNRSGLTAAVQEFCHELVS